MENALSATVEHCDSPILNNFKEPFIPETQMHSVALLDAHSAEGLGQDLTLVEPNDGLPYVVFSNVSKTEALVLIFHYGGSRNAFSELEIRAHNNDVSGVVLDIEHFRSGRGIQLGMSKKVVEKILGPSNNSSTSPNNLRYRLTDQERDASSFLKQYNYPSYYLHADFIDDRLVRYRFGFDYP